MDKISSNFNRYSNLKKEGCADYFLDLTKLKIVSIKNPVSSTDAIIAPDTVPIYCCHNLPNQKLKKHMRLMTKKIVTILDKKIIDHLNPDKIDNVKFWKTATKHFPFSPISGGIPSYEEYQQLNSKTILEIGRYINSRLIYLANAMGALKELDKIFRQNKRAKILEIGPGYGSLMTHMLNNNYSLENYISIDINPLFNSEKILQCDGKNIPSGVPSNLDCVYSVNVFQHLTENQKTSYLKQVYLILKNGGKFILTDCIETPENSNLPYWGLKDRKGRNYIGFFNQFIKIMKLSEYQTILDDIGFKTKIVFNEPTVANHITMVLTKEE